MTDVVERTVVVLLASGLSRRFKRRDKLLQDLAGRPLVDHMASKLEQFDFLARVAVCPSRGEALRNRLGGKFIIAPNSSPEAGLGVSISVGVRVAMQFRPEAVLICLGDMAFVEPRSLLHLLMVWADHPSIDIVHSGGDEMRPPAVFGRGCFEALQGLKGDRGAGALLKRPEFRHLGVGLSGTELLDVDTEFDLETARRQAAIRERHLGRFG